MGNTERKVFHKNEWAHGQHCQESGVTADSQTKQPKPRLFRDKDMSVKETRMNRLGGSVPETLTFTTRKQNLSSVNSPFQEIPPIVTQLAYLAKGTARGEEVTKKDRPIQTANPKTTTNVPSEFPNTERCSFEPK